MQQFILGLTFDAGGNTFVISANSALTVPIAKEFTIRVTRALQDKGVKVIGSKVKFPASQKFNAVIAFDRQFMEAQVRETTPEIVAASFAGIKFDSKFSEGADKLFNEIDPHGEIAKMLDALTSDGVETSFKQLWQSLSANFSKVNWTKVSEELTLIAEKNQEKIPAPFLDE